MKRTILIIIIALLGIGIFTYPYIANYFSERNASRVIDNYDKIISNKDTAFLEEEKRKAKEYNDKLSGKSIKAPFLEDTGTVMDSDYINILNIDGVMGYVRIPKINVNLSIYHGTSETVLQKGVGHLEGAALPIGGVRDT